MKAARFIGVDCDDDILLCRSSKIVSSIRLVMQKKIIGSNHEPTPMIRKVADNILKPSHSCQGLYVPMLKLVSTSAPTRIPAVASMKRAQNTAKAVLELFFTFSKLAVLTVAKRNLKKFSNRDFFAPVIGKTTKLIVALRAMNKHQKFIIRTI